MFLFEYDLPPELSSNSALDIYFKTHVLQLLMLKNYMRSKICMYLSYKSRLRARTHPILWASRRK